MKSLFVNLSKGFDRTKRFFALVYDAIRGVEHDYTKGSTRQAIILLAIPMVLEMGMESVFAVVDIFFVSQLGSDAVAVVGLTEAVLTLIYAVAMGFGMGITAVIARRIGEGDSHGAALTAGQALFIGLLASLVIAALGIPFAGDILRLMGASERAVEMGESYTRIMLGGSATIVFLFIIAAVFRGAGNAIIAMRALWLANGVNIILDPCFIFGWGPFPELGVTGAAVATNIGRTLGVLYMLYHLFYGDTSVKIKLQHLIYKAQVAINLLRVSLGGIVQFLIATTSWVFLARIVAQYGSDDVAGYTIAMRIAMFTFLPAWGLSNAAATLVGQNLGAKKPDRAESSVWLTAKYNVIFMASVGVILFVFAEQFIRFFSSDPAVVEIGKLCLSVIALGYPFFGLGMVLTQSFNGSGDTNTPTKINFVCFWLIQIPFAWVAANLFGLETLGVVISVAFAESLIALTAWLIFRRGKWKLVNV